MVIAGTLGVAGAIMAESSLSFLGLGVQPPTPSWGSMIADGRDLYQLRHAPWTSVFPGLAIGAAVLGFNLLGDALRDALDPRNVRASMPRGAGLRRHRRGRELRRRRRSAGPSFPGRTTARRSTSTMRPPARCRSARCASLDEWSRLRANPQRISHDLQFDTLARGRELIARLIGADAGEIALATNTSYGINLAAFSLPLRAGDVVAVAGPRVSGQRLSVDAARRASRNRVSPRRVRGGRARRRRSRVSSTTTACAS